MMRALFKVPSVVADYTVGTVIVLVQLTLLQGRTAHAERRRLAA
jgi:hypothetical protein